MEATTPICETCGSQSVVVTLTIWQVGKFKPTETAEGQWLRCQKCTRHWFEPLEVRETAMARSLAR